MEQGGSRHDAPEAARLRNLRRGGIAAGLLGLCAACSITPDLAVLANVNPMQWHDSTTVVIRNTDTLARRTLRIVVRSNENLAHDTLTLRIATVSPDSRRYEEPFMLRIPRAPKSAPLRREAVLLYRTDVILADTGDYRFTFTPTRLVRGIEAVGIHIAKD